MQSGVLFGLTAALCWGVADLCARGATRIAGTFRTLLYVQTVAALALLVVGLPTGLLRLSRLPLGLTLLAAALQVVVLAGAALLYRAFAIGVISLVSPIAASFAALTALLALLSGERPTWTQLLGVALTFCGVVFASMVSGGSAAQHDDTPNATKRWRSARGRLAPGVVEALGATLLFGVPYWALRYVVGPLGGVTTAFIGKVAEGLVLLALGGGAWLVARLAPHRAGGPLVEASVGANGGERVVGLFSLPSQRFLVFVLPVAILDTAANVAYNLGIAGALTSVVSVLASLFSAVTATLAAIFLHERLTRRQLFGVVIILCGVALVSV